MLYKQKKSLLVFVVLLLSSRCAFYQYIYLNLQVDKDKIGKVIDQFNGVNVYYNGSKGNVNGRHITPDGYNCRKYQ